MRNIVLFLILVSGLLAGYFVGDYRNEEARKALDDAIETGESVDHELREANSKLRTELDTVNARYKNDIEKLHAEYSSKSAQWQSVKNRLDDNIQRQNKKLVELNVALDELITMLGRSAGAEKAQLEGKIAILRFDIALLRQEVSGNTCLKTQVPHRVVEAINETDNAGTNK